MNDTLAAFARILLRPEATASIKKDFLRTLSVGVAHDPSLADQALADTVAIAAQDRWWGVRQSAMWTLGTIFIVRPDLATREITECVAKAIGDSVVGEPTEDVAKAAKRTLDCIVRSRPDLAALIQPATPLRPPASPTLSDLDHV